MNSPSQSKSLVSIKGGALLMGISPGGFQNLAKRRIWATHKRAGKNYYLLSDVQAELERRERGSDAPDAIARHTEGCAATIRQYWLDRGFTVSVKADGGEIISDLVNGWPRR